MAASLIFPDRACTQGAESLKKFPRFLQPPLVGSGAVVVAIFECINMRQQFLIQACVIVNFKNGHGLRKGGGECCRFHAGILVIGLWKFCQSDHVSALHRWRRCPFGASRT